MSLRSELSRPYDARPMHPGGVGIEWSFQATIRLKTPMALRRDQDSMGSSPILSNAEIADRLASLAQLLSSQKENPYKVKAYQRAAAADSKFLGEPG